jgi:hypothetical protein
VGVPPPPPPSPKIKPQLARTPVTASASCGGRPKGTRQLGYQMCVHSSASMEIHSAGALSPLAPRPHDENGTVVGRARTLTIGRRRCVPARRNLASDKGKGNTYDMVTTHRSWWPETNISKRRMPPDDPNRIRRQEVHVGGGARLACTLPTR